MPRASNCHHSSTGSEGSHCPACPTDVSSQLRSANSSSTPRGSLSPGPALCVSVLQRSYVWREPPGSVPPGHSISLRWTSASSMSTMGCHGCRLRMERKLPCRRNSTMRSQRCLPERSLRHRLRRRSPGPGASIYRRNPQTALCRTGGADLAPCCLCRYEQAKRQTGCCLLPPGGTVISVLRPLLAWEPSPRCRPWP